MRSSTRNSNLELLKIIAILFIIISHTMPFYYIPKDIMGHIDINIVTRDIQTLILIILRYLGQIGNMIFIFCSSYFFIDNNKITLKKVMSIIVDSFIISIGMYFLCIACGYNIESKEIIKYVFPITYMNNWFIGYYLLFYLIHPGLNYVINAMKKRDLFLTNIIMIFFLCVVQFLVPSYYNPLMGFILLYFIMAYQKKYLNNFSKNKKKNIVLLFISCMTLILFTLLINKLGKNNICFFNKMQFFNNLINPVFIVLAISIFNIFNNILMKNNNIINYISSNSLVIYLIHENKVMYEIIRPRIFEYIYINFSYDYLIIWCVLLSIITFFICLVLGSVYKQTIRKFFEKIIDKFNIYVMMKTNKVLDRLEKY